MRSVYLVTLIVLFACSSESQITDPNYTYDDFVRQFGRNYTGIERD